jgi:hypothetical protein
MASVTRTYHTTFDFEHVLDSLEKEGLNFRESVKGRIFFRVPGLTAHVLSFVGEVSSC